MCPQYPGLVADLAASVTCPVRGGPGTGGCLMVVAPGSSQQPGARGTSCPALMGNNDEESRVTMSAA